MCVCVYLCVRNVWGVCELYGVFVRGECVVRYVWHLCVRGARGMCMV